MKSFEIIMFGKDNKHVLSMRCTLRKNFIGTDEEIVQHLRPIAAKNVLKDGSYYVSWKNDGFPSGFLVIR